MSTLPAGALLTGVVFCGYLLARNWHSPVEYLARNDLFIILGALMVYLLTAVLFVRVEERRILLCGLLGLGVAQVILGAIQFRYSNQYMPFPWMQRADNWWRASGFYISPNHFAGLIEVVALLAFSLAFWGKRPVWQRVLMGYIGVCCVVGIAISGSRGGYLALMGGALCLVLLSLWSCRFFYRGRWALIAASTMVAAALVVGVAGTIMFQSDTLRMRFFDIHEPHNMRFLLWSAALEQFRLDPTWGTGSGTYLYYGRTFRDPLVQYDPIFVHNDYLHLLAEYGMVGAGAFLLFFLWHSASGLRTIGTIARKVNVTGETKSDELALHLGALSAIGAYVIHSAVDFNLHMPANALVMALVFGIVANSGMAKPRMTALEKGVAGGGRALLFAIGVFVLFYGVPLLRGEWYSERTRQALKSYQLEETRSLAAEGLKYERSNPDLYYYAGEAARELAANQAGPVQALQEEAIGMFKKGLELFPDDSRTLLKLAEAYDQAKRFDEAEEVLIQADELDPNSLYVHAYYGMHYRDRGQILEAANEFQIARELDRDSQFKIVQVGFAEVQKILAAIPATPLPDPNAEPEEPEEPMEEEAVPEATVSGKPASMEPVSDETEKEEEPEK
ncbi:MAG: O-antigen ligase family protein [Verrucomicrobiota bacterium]